MMHKRNFVAYLLVTALASAGCAVQKRGDPVKSVAGLRDTYSGAVEYENTYKTAHYSDDPDRMFETARLMESSEGRSKEFWNVVDSYIDQYGKHAAITSIRQIVQENGLCMIMADYRGRMILGSQAFDGIVAEFSSRQSRYYAYATAANGFNPGSTFLKRSQLSLGKGIETPPR